MESIGSIIFSITGLILILIFFLTIIKNIRIKKLGILTTARVVTFVLKEGIKDEHGSTSKLNIPVYKFDHINNNGSSKTFRVEGKSNSVAKIGEETPIYYNPNNPEKEYYLPKKDFLIKYVFLVVGFVFFSIGVLMEFDFYKTHFSSFGINIKDKKDFFLTVFIVLFSATLVLYLIGLLSNLNNDNRKHNT